jgi:hypothetical protein
MNMPVDNALLIEYFEFEKDFVDDNIRCIPMIVRFKLDACGVKLKLKEWSKMSLEERENLADFSIRTTEDLNAYRSYLKQTIASHDGGEPTYFLPDPQDSLWAVTDQIPARIRDKVGELNTEVTLEQWRSLTILKRYALLKLTRAGHENKNFPIALKEFGLI